MIPAAQALVLELLGCPFPAGWSHQTCAVLWLTLVPPERFLHLWLQSNTAYCVKDAEGPHWWLLAVSWLGHSFRVTRLWIQAEKNQDPKSPILTFRLLNNSLSSQKITESWIILRSTESRVHRNIWYVTFPASCLKTSRLACRCIESLYKARPFVKLILRLRLLV